MSTRTSACSHVYSDSWEDFPSPPVSSEELNQALATYNAAREAAILAAAQSAQGTAAKDDALDRMVDLMKTNLRYAESTARQDDGKLQLLGWGAPRSRTTTGIPGQVRTLEVLREGASWLFLDWKEPVDGGDPAAYKVQRRKRDGGEDWIDVGMAVESEWSAARSRAELPHAGRFLTCSWESAVPDAGIEERVARLEGRVEGFEDRFASLERRLDGLDRKIDGIDHKLSSRIEVLDHRLSSRIEALDTKISRHFTWTVGIQVAVLLAVVAALAGR